MKKSLFSRKVRFYEKVPSKHLQISATPNQNGLWARPDANFAHFLEKIQYLVQHRFLSNKSALCATNRKNRGKVNISVPLSKMLILGRFGEPKNLLFSKTAILSTFPHFL